MKIRSAVLILSLAALAALGPEYRFGAVREEPQPPPRSSLTSRSTSSASRRSYRLIERYGETIWPGWKNDMEVEFQLQYPNLVFVTVGPRDGKVPEGYVEVPGRAVRGRKIYVNRKDELPIKLLPPLIGGGKGGMTIRIMLQQTGITAEQAANAIAEAEKRTPTPASSRPCHSEGQILLIVHEFFHGFQTKVMMKREGGARGQGLRGHSRVRDLHEHRGTRPARRARRKRTTPRRSPSSRITAWPGSSSAPIMPPEAVAYQARNDPLRGHGQLFRYQDGHAHRREGICPEHERQG